MLVAGLDGGGTKTEGVVLDEAGEVVASARSGGTNLNFVPLEECERSVLEVLSRLAEVVDRAQVVRVYSTFIPDLPTIRTEMQAVFPNALWQPQAEHRAVLAAGGVLKPYGIGVVAGTGSSTVGWRGEEKYASVGGWGMLLGDEGSATDIAIHALRAVIHASDGRGEPTSLREEMLDYFELKHLWEITHRVYRDNLPRHILAGFAVRVSRAANAGDRVAQRILREAGETLGSDVLVVARKLFTPDETFPVVLGGGVFRAGEWVIAPLRERVLAEYPKAQVILPDVSPAVGLARLALKD
ncbi:MAG: N-acetylmuramic acid/N-acetylglucosamine kinase [Armatimonadota bacterium]|nr:MAG: N-acetylmuramic acid/N-acetylglucosamine kinase [Armatimonadota bacterium]